MRKLSVVEPSSTSAEELSILFRKDTSLPNAEDYERMVADPSIIPTELRVFDLVFPKVIFPGLFEGGGADRVTDDSIAALVWDGNSWKRESLLAGPRGWCRTGPDHCGTRARVLRYDA